LDIGRDPITGKRRQKLMSGYATKREAERAAAEMSTEFERGNVSISANKDTLGSFMKEYLETTLRNEIERNTYEGKVAIMNNHVVPNIGKLKLQKITPMDIQKFVNQLQDEGFNPGTIRNIMRLVNQTLRTAMEWGYVTKNVTVFAKKPNYKAKKHSVWTREQWDIFLEANKESRFYPFYLIALNTGMRPGEVLALSWDQINLKQKFIRVDRTVVYTKENGIQIKESPKNDSSRRNVTIPESVVTYLKKYKLEQTPNRLNLVIPGIKSEIVYNSTLNDCMKDDIKKAAVPVISPHELRHTHATYLLSPKPFGLGIGVKAVSERLGHATTTVTMNTYAHVLENMQEAIADALDELTPKTQKNQVDVIKM
jgi:integrase